VEVQYAAVAVSSSPCSAVWRNRLPDHTQPEWNLRRGSSHGLVPNRSKTRHNRETLQLCGLNPVYQPKVNLIRKRTRTGGGGDDKGCHATALLKASWCRPCWRPRQRGCSGRLLPRCLGPSTWTWSGCNLLQSYAAMGPDLSALNKGYSAASHQCLHGCSLTWRRGIVLSDPRKIAWLFEYTIPNFDTFPFIVLWCLPRIVNTLIMKRITPN